MGLNEKQAICLVCGLFFLIAAVCFSTWALAGGSSNRPRHSGSTEIDAPSGEFTSPRQRLRQHFWKNKEAVIEPAPLKLEPVEIEENFIEKSSEENRINQSDVAIRNWRDLIDGVDLYELDHTTAKDRRIGRSETDLITLSYLSLSVFLLNQMDQLLDAQSEAVASSRNFQRKKKTQEVEERPRHFNSLNILLVDSKRLENTTDSGNILAKEYSNNYAQLGVNLIKASQMERAEGNGIDCIWTAYCIELNNRASLKGVVGSIARINGIVLELMSGQLVPRQALEKLLPSLMKWTDLQCHTLFPKCGATEAMDYLQLLAFTPNE